MDKKILAIIIVAVVVVAGAATAIVVMNDNKDGATYSDGAYNIVSRVNTEGSGVYIKESLISGYTDGVPYRTVDGKNVPYYNVNGSTYSVSSDNAAAWGGLIVGTPGTSSIQHIQMATLVSNLGLNFKLYTSGTARSTDTVYYNSGITNASLAKSDSIDAGILWEPQHQLIITGSEGFTQLALTNNLFPGHTCCVIAGNHKYVTSHSDATEAFLKGYAKAVDKINSIKADKTSDEYKSFIAFIREKVPALTSDAQAEAALENITYLYADDASGSMDKLESDISALTGSLDDLGVLTKTVKDRGAFVDAFVDDSYMKNAISKDIGSSSKGNITVAVISGDIHQIAIHYAISEGYFSAYGLNVTLSNASNGSGIATALQNGEAQFGFLGAPPATITTINGGLITA